MAVDGAAVTLVQADTPRRTGSLFRKIRKPIDRAGASGQGRDGAYLAAVAKARADMVDAVEDGIVADDAGKRVRLSRVARALYGGALGGHGDI